MYFVNKNLRFKDKKKLKSVKFEKLILDNKSCNK